MKRQREEGGSDLPHGGRGFRSKLEPVQVQ